MTLNSAAAAISWKHHARWMFIDSFRSWAQGARCSGKNAAQFMLHNAQLNSLEKLYNTSQPRFERREKNVGATEVLSSISFVVTFVLKGGLMFLLDRGVECPIYYPVACSSTSMTMTLHHVWNGSKWTLFVYWQCCCSACLVSVDLLRRRRMALLCISSHAVKRLTAGAQMCAHETGVSAGNTAGILLSKECVPFQFFCGGRVSEDILKAADETFISHADSLHICPSTGA